MIGSRLGHYEILALLGAGGMGEVYRARDTRLGREVALKLLPERLAADSVRIERLTREAQAVARLSHPGIVTLYAIEEVEGRSFLTMELVGGRTLGERIAPGGLDAASFFALAAPIAEALAAAHRLGVVHRDLKPANVMVTDDGRPKILDFGLAKRVEAEPAPHASAADTASALTGEGVAVGTLPYMSPEQLLGRGVDARTDVYAFGAMLYELATGQRPLQAGTDAELVSAILRDPPPPLRRVRPELPPALEGLVARCLEKDPARRPADAAALATELAAIAAALGAGGGPLRWGSSAVRAAEPPAGIRSLAVLPLENVTKDPAQDYFADGLTESLVSDLARLKSLRVISRTTVMKFKGASRALPEIAAELGVDAVLEGSALLVGRRVRVTVRLVHAASDETLWTERYDGDLENVLDLQSDVAAAVAREIAAHVTGAESDRLARHRAVNPEAHLEYLKGLHLYNEGSPQAVELALRHFTRALELDPDFAPAWAGIADSHWMRANRGMAPPAEASERGIAAATRALALDDSLAEGHAALGALRLVLNDFAGALGPLKRAVELNPSLTKTHHLLGRLHYCSERHAEARQAMLRALALDPLSMLLHTAVGDSCYYAREYETSLVYYEKAIALDPRFDGAHTDYARSLEAVGRFDEARAQYEEGRRLSGGVAGPSFGLAHLEVSRGRPDEARRMLAELIAARASRVVSAWGIAAVHAHLGEADEAFRWLDTAVEERATGLTFLRVHPRLDPIRRDPRLATLIRRVGLDRV